MNESIRTLLERRSVRAYKQQPVSEEHLEIILKAGSYAPTAMNRQSPIMVAVTNPEEVALLSKLNAAVMAPQTTPSTVRPPLWWCWQTAASPRACMTAALLWAT